MNKFINEAMTKLIFKLPIKLVKYHQNKTEYNNEKLWKDSRCKKIQIECEYLLETLIELSLTRMRMNNSLPIKGTLLICSDNHNGTILSLNIIQHIYEQISVERA